MDTKIEERRAEGLARLALLGVSEEAVAAFRDRGEAMVSDDALGGYRELRDWERDYVRRIEARYGVSVYLAAQHDVALSMAAGALRFAMPVLSLLVVSDDRRTDDAEQSRWDWEREELQQGWVNTYGVNLVDDSFSEFGGAGFHVTPEGLLVVDR